MSRTSAATFTVTPAPTSPLTVRLWVTESGGFLPPGGWAGHEVTVPTGGSATFSVPTVNDNLEGRTGRVSLRVEVGDGYSLDNMNWQARVTVNDNDGPGGRTPGIPSVPAVPATRPDAPGRLRAVPADGAVTLSWDAPRDDGGARITDYEYQINGEGEWISIGSANRIHTITGLTNGRAYVFRVRAVNRVGRSEASNRVKAIAGAVLDLAHFANGTGITSEFVFLNVSPQPTGPALYFYDQGGALMDPASVVEVAGDLMVTEDVGLTVHAEMEPLEALTISTHGRGELLSGSVRVVSGVPIGGMLRFEHPALGVTGVGASQPVSDVIFPVQRQEGGINTGVALHNLESSSGLLRCALLREGLPLDSVSIPLEANAQTSWTIDTGFPSTDTSDLLGSLRCTATAGGSFSAAALEMNPVTRVFTALPVVPLAARTDQE